MEITKQKSFTIRTFSNVAAGITATLAFWLLVAVGLFVVSALGALALWPFSDVMAGMSVAMLNGQVVMVFAFAATVYLISGAHKEFGILGDGIGLLIFTIIVLSVDFERYFPGLNHWIAENCKTFPWFGILIAVFIGLWVLAIYYSSIFSGVVFDFVRNRFGIDGKTFSQFDGKVNKNKILFRLPMLWSLVALVLIALYSSINVALDPQLAQRANEMVERQEAQKLAKELDEQFEKPGKTDLQFKHNPDVISNLFAPMNDQATTQTGGHQ